ncbi:MAG: cell division protein FtsK [Desulfobacterales bacterium CG23_combo_of_CG06-09_8_20_14_all_51_8]|nr:MAG: cell division protein FtsK [Desulfobacterales bacterium CG23_combo_of_CG06-09_8_20_14_all_51_8]
MRRELVSLLLIFIVIFSLISLVTYSPADPSIHHAGHVGEVENFFGLFGAHVAGFLIGLFGLGAFWIPVLFLIASIEFFKNRSGQALAIIGCGGILLVVATGSLVSLFHETSTLFGNSYPSGGMIGLPIQSFFLEYSNWTGGIVILSFFLLVGFILSTGVSLVAVIRNLWKLGVAVAGRMNYFMTAMIQRWKIRKQHKKSLRKEKQGVHLPMVGGKNREIDPLPEKTLSKPEPLEKDDRNRHPEPARGDILIKETLPPKHLRSVPIPRQQVFESMRFDSGIKLPSIDFLKDADITISAVDHENLLAMSRLLEQKLDDFGVKGKIVTVLPGPVVTRFEFEPAPGIKINKVVNLTDDLALALRAISIRIIAPIPGKAAIGVEVPNARREIVVFKDVVASQVFDKSKSRLTLAMGKDIVGNPVVADLENMPHLLIAGATGTGKSVALNTMICSLLYKSTPEEVKLIMIDPKRIELSMYDGIPHLITPVVTDMKKATNALFWAVREMERRYMLLSESRVRNIRQYNRKIEKEAEEERPDGETPREKLPYVVIVIDELADLMMVSSRDVEVSLTRLAQMARASGIHLILATQRPSVDVLTGVIKANFPTRLSFQVSSKTDSRTIIDANGAETLLGNGDMLFLPPGTAKLQRIHGAYISEEELTKIIEFLKAQMPPDYNHAILEAPEKESGNGDDREYDDRYDEAVALVSRTGQASISMIQRHLRIGYNRAARIIEIMEQEGVVGPSDGVKAREVLVKNYDDMQ